MKGFTLLVIATVLVAGCSKGGDPPASSTTASGTPGAAPSSTENAPTAVKPTPTPGQATSAATATAGAAKPHDAPVKTSNSTGSYTFNFAPVVGKIIYNTSRKEDQGDGKPNIATAVMTTTTTKNADGTITIQSESTGVNGMPPVKTTQILDLKGKVLKTTTDTGGGEHAVPNGASVVNSFPGHPVKVGESWTKTETLPQGNVLSTYKLVKVDGDLATVEVSRDSKIPKTKISSKSVLQLELSTGTPYSVTSDTLAENVPGPKGPRTVKLHTEMRRQ